MRYNGSIKGAQNKASLTSAPGVWTINDVQENALIETWPGSDIEYDILILLLLVAVVVEVEQKITPLVVEVVEEGIEKEVVS